MIIKHKVKETGPKLQDILVLKPIRLINIDTGGYETRFLCRSIVLVHVQKILMKGKPKYSHDKICWVTDTTAVVGKNIQEVQSLINAAERRYNVTR